MSRALLRCWSLTYIDNHRPLEILTGHVGPLRFGGNRGTDILHIEKPLRGRTKHLRWVGARYARTRWNNVSLRWIRLQSALWQDGWSEIHYVVFCLYSCTDLSLSYLEVSMFKNHIMYNYVYSKTTMVKLYAYITSLIRSCMIVSYRIEFVKQ